MNIQNRKNKRSNRSTNSKNTEFYIVYTVAFLLIAFFLYMRFYLNGKSLVWSHDGVPQHLNSLAYYGRYLRGILYTIFVEHRFSIPMWDLHIGYGSDILTTLNCWQCFVPLPKLRFYMNS